MNLENSVFKKALRFTIATVVMGIFVAVIVVPYFVPQPEMYLQMPGYIALGDDLAFTVQVNAWQGNFRINKVTILSNKTESTSKGGYGVFDRITIENDRSLWSYTGYATLVGRIPFPRKTEFGFTIPLSEMSANGQLGRGRLTGEILVSWQYETLEGDSSANRHSTRSIEERKYKRLDTSLPFAIDIQ